MGVLHEGVSASLAALEAIRGKVDGDEGAKVAEDLGDVLLGHLEAQILDVQPHDPYGRTTTHGRHGTSSSSSTSSSASSSSSWMFIVIPATKAIVVAVVVELVVVVVVIVVIIVIVVIVVIVVEVPLIALEIVISVISIHLKRTPVSLARLRSRVPLVGASDVHCWVEHWP